MLIDFDNLQHLEIKERMFSDIKTKAKQNRSISIPISIFSWRPLPWLTSPRLSLFGICKQTKAGLSVSSRHS